MIPLYKPYMPDNLFPELNEILYSGNLNYGKYGKLFELKLREYVGCDYLLTVNSYNTAVLVILSTLGLKPGDEVIASPVSCLASNQPFVIKGLNVIWADVNPKTGTLCPEDVRKKISNKTKAIFHNHFCGYVGEIDAINKIGAEFGISIIDDGIEAFGSEFKGRRLGNVGTDFTVFSFQTVRLPNTIEGAALIFKDKSFYEKALLIRDFGIDRTRFRTELGEINPDCDISIEGYAGLMGELNSFIGIRQLNDIDSLLLKQQMNAKKWSEKFRENSTIKILDNNMFAKANYWVLGTLCKDKINTIKRFKDDGFQASGVHINNNIYSVFNDKKTLLGVNEFISHFVALPCGWWVN